MKIGCFELDKWEQEHFKKNLKNHNLIFGGHLTQQTVSKVKDCDAIVIFVHSFITENILNKLPKLKLIVTLSTGFDHIDLNACRKRKITVCNVPYYGENTVAEHAFALLLALSHRIVDGVEKTRNNEFDPSGLEGFDLKGKTLGVIGVGHIGQHIIRIAKGFEMDVLGFNRSREEKLAKELGFKYVNLDNLLKNSDIITLHLTLNPGTKHIINLEKVKLMKKGVYVINTARGALIDTSALIYGLKSRIINGAGLDVLEGEDYLKDERQLLKKKISKQDLEVVIKNHQLLKKHNVIVTPHSAFNTKEAVLRILDSGIQSIQGFAKGGNVNEIKEG